MSNQELSSMQKKVTRLDRWNSVKCALTTLLIVIGFVSYAFGGGVVVFSELSIGDWPSLIICIILFFTGLFLGDKFNLFISKTFQDDERDITIHRKYVNGRTLLSVTIIHVVILSLCYLAINNVQYNFSGQDFVYNVEAKQDEVLPVVSYLPLERNKMVRYATDLEISDVRLVTSFDINNDQKTDFVVEALYTLRVANQESWVDFVHAEARNQKNATTFFKLAKSVVFLIQEELKKKMVDWDASYFSSENFPSLFQRTVRELFLEKGLKLDTLKVELVSLKTNYIN